MIQKAALATKAMFLLQCSSYEVSIVMTNSSPAGAVFRELSEVEHSLTRRGLLSVKTMKPSEVSGSENENCHALGAFKYSSFTV